MLLGRLVVDAYWSGSVDTILQDEDGNVVRVVGWVLKCGPPLQAACNAQCPAALGGV